MVSFGNSCFNNIPGWTVVFTINSNIKDWKVSGFKSCDHFIKILITIKLIMRVILKEEMVFVSCFRKHSGSRYVLC